MLALLHKILVVLLVVGAGMLARRRGVIDAAGSALLSRLVVDLAFPALVVAQLARTVDLAALRLSWPLPLLGAGVVALGLLVGAAAAAVALPRRSSDRRTVAFLVSVPNWIFLPLLIVQTLHGAAGVRAVLLLNAGAVTVLWTAGVWWLQGGRLDRHALVALLRNPGVWATAAGIGLALLWPGARATANAQPAALDLPAYVGAAALDALQLVGSATVPLAVFVTGAQLGGLGRGALLFDRALGAALAGRLLVVPLALLGLGVAAAAAGYRLEPVAEEVALIVAAMPVAMSASLFVTRFGGAADLAARAVFWSTFLSALTAPAVFAAYQRLR